MASVRKLVSGNYQVRFRDPSGRERSRTFPRKADADLFASKVGYELKVGDWMDPRAGRITLEDWYEEAWQLGPSVRERTATDRASRMRRHVLPVFGQQPLSSIERSSVQLWVNDLSASGLATATVKKVFETLSSVLRTAVSYGKLSRTPCERIVLPPPTLTEMRFLVPEEVDRLAEAITPHFELLIRFAAETGLRINEIAGLQGGDFDAGTGVVSVKRQLRKDSTPPAYSDPKTRAGTRSLTLSPTLAQRVAGIGAVGNQPIFTSPEGSLLNVSNFRRRHFKPALDAAGLGHVRIHDLRHTAVSSWIRHGASIKEVTGRAGIRSVTTAFDRYGHVYPEADRELAQRLDRPPEVTGP